MGSKNEKQLKDHLTNTADYLINWSRQYSLWPMFFGLSCCFVEEAAAFTARYDMARFGAEVFRGSPRQADMMIVSGTVTEKMAPIVRRLWDQMPEPKWVIALGNCAISGGPFVFEGQYGIVEGADKFLPVDVYVPGCPPRPEALIEGIIELEYKISGWRRWPKPKPEWRTTGTEES